jgi:putative ABC transport system permease protein
MPKIEFALPERQRAGLADVSSDVRYGFRTLVRSPGFAFAALAAIGTYGVMAYVVSQGARAIGIRVALGATGRQVGRLVLSQGLTLAAAGLAIGVAGAFWLSRLMSTLLYGVSASDPLTFAVVPAILLIVALVAGYVPARRAARVDPVLSLRCE